MIETKKVSILTQVLHHKNNVLQLLQDKKLVLVFGRGGSGKSTVINWLNEAKFQEELEMRPMKLHQHKISILNKDKEVISLNEDAEQFYTPFLKLAYNPNDCHVLVEVPSLDQIKSTLVRLCNLIYLQNLIVHFSKSLKILLVMDKLRSEIHVNPDCYMNMLGMLMKNLEIFNANKDSLFVTILSFESSQST